MNGAERIRTPGSVAVKVQSGRRTAVQSVVGLGSRDTCVGSIDAIGEGVAVWVGVMVGMGVEVGLMLAVPVAVGGGLVQVAGRTTWVLVRAGVLEGWRVVGPRGTQLVNTAKLKAIAINRVIP